MTAEGIFLLSGGPDHGPGIFSPISVDFGGGKGGGGILGGGIPMLGKLGGGIVGHAILGGMIFGGGK